MPHEKNTVHMAGHIAYIALYSLLIIFTILFYNWANSEVLLYPGWIFLALGISILLLATSSRKKGYASETKVANKNLVESRMYAFVSHPGFLGHILVIFALILLGQRWPNLVIGATMIVLLYLAMIREEKMNIEKFGDEYERYMQKVPRINLLAGIIRQMRYKKGNERGR